MALSDITAKIATDASHEAADVIGVAEAAAAAVLGAAEADAEKIARESSARAMVEASREAGTATATARLSVRDSGLQARSALISDVLDQLRLALVALPDDEYAGFYARHIAEAARGGERVHIAQADRDRLATALPAAVARIAPGLELEWDDVTVDVDHGVVLVGDRVRVELTDDAIIDERRDELEMVIGRALFGAGVGAGPDATGASGER